MSRTMTMDAIEHDMATKMGAKAAAGRDLSKTWNVIEWVNSSWRQVQSEREKAKP